MARSPRAKPVTPEELRRRVGANLTRIMAERGITEDDLAELLGLPPHGARNLRKYMRGEKWPREDTLAKWGSVLKTDPIEFLRNTP